MRKLLSIFTQSKSNHSPKKKERKITLILGSRCIFSSPETLKNQGLAFSTKSEINTAESTCVSTLCASEKEIQERFFTMCNEYNDIKGRGMFKADISGTLDGEEINETFDDTYAFRDFLLQKGFSVAIRSTLDPRGP